MENEKRMRRKRGGAKIDGKEIGQDMNKMKHISESVRQEKKRSEERRRDEAKRARDAACLYERTARPVRREA